MHKSKYKSRAHLLEIPLLIHGDYVAVDLGVLLQMRGGRALAFDSSCSFHPTRKITSLEKGDTVGPLSRVIHLVVAIYTSVGLQGTISCSDSSE